MADYYMDFDRIFKGKEFIIATDFDDTLVVSYGFPKFDETTKWFHTLKATKEEYPNVKVILWTCREGKYLEDAIAFCKEHGLAVNEDIPSSLAWKGKTRKPFAHIYVDDRGVYDFDFEDFLREAQSEYGE